MGNKINLIKENLDNWAMVGNALSTIVASDIRGLPNVITQKGIQGYIAITEGIPDEGLIRMTAEKIKRGDHRATGSNAEQFAIPLVSKEIRIRQIQNLKK